MGNFLDSDRRQWIAIVVALVTLIVGVLIVWSGYISHTSDRVYFSITEFCLPQSDTFTIGENSDICWKDIPEKYMTVSYDNATNRYSYTINKPDSCYYYKINNHNPNKHIISDTSKISSLGVTLTLSDIKAMLDTFENEHYMLSEVLLKKDPSLKPKIDSLAEEKVPLNSVIYRKKRRFGRKGKKYELIILDKHTTFNDTGYCYSDTIAECSEFKIQFFSVAHWSIPTEYTKKGAKYFNDGFQTHYAKTSQLFTEWGAGHVKVDRQGKQFNVSFPKAITIAIPTTEIENASSRLGVGVYLKQTLNSYPLSSDFYIPAFSNALPEEICELSTDKWMCFQRSNARDTVQLTESVRGLHSLFPTIDVHHQDLATGSITYKLRVLNKNFYRSKHWMLLIVWILLFVLLFVSFPQKGDFDAKNVRWYIVCMFTLFYYYLNQKLMIGEKLSYTYPYFEKIFPVTYLTTLFSLCALFVLIIIVNRAFFRAKKSEEVGNGFTENDYYYSKWHTKKERSKKEKPWFRVWRIILGVFASVVVVASCVGATCMIWESFISPIWNSYLDSDRSLLSLWDLVLPDNHFWVPIAVIIAPAIIAFLIWVIELLDLHKRSQKCFDWYFQCWQGLSKTNSFKKIIGGIVLIILFAIPIVVPAVILMWVGGNYGTAIAVFIMVLFVGEYMFSLSKRMSTYIPNGGVRFLYIFFSGLGGCCCFVGIGMGADFGFFINVFGIVLAWLVLVPLVIGDLDNDKDNTGRKNKKTICVVESVLLVGLFVGLLLGGSNIGRLFSNYEKVDYGRGTRRIHNVLDPQKVKEVGYSYTESDMQWMEAVRFYAEKVSEKNDTVNDIYGEENSFHRLLSTGMSPVILNDASVPGAYLGPLRKSGWWGVIFGLFAMGLVVYVFSVVQYVYGRTDDLAPGGNGNALLTRRQIWRLLAASIWILESVYLIASYYWLKVPFTGRLIPGFGVDAVGEALEILVLFTFMCSMSDPYKVNEEK